MKKNGFTLAEVLITLAIIGVVATLTLPSLMSNTQEQQAITGFRKAMNTLNEIGQMNAAVDGFDYSGITVTTAPSSRAVYNSTTGILEQSLWGMMSTKAQVDATASISKKVKVPNCGNYTNQIFFRDGTVLCYESATTSGNANAVINAVIDTNGLKAPNTISSCTKNDCVTPANRSIRDQFRITLRGATAIPGTVTYANGQETTKNPADSAASAWALRK